MKKRGGNNVRHTPIVTRNIDGYQIHVLDDGVDYPGLVGDFMKGALPARRLANSGKHRRTAHLVEAGGRKYVVKIDPRPGNEWAQRLWQMLTGSRGAGLMRRINRAVDEGCDVTPRICLTAEKIRGRLVTKSIVVVEYVEGRQLELNGFPPRISDASAAAVAEAMRGLHSFRLAHTDISPGNFIVADSGVKIIDLTFRGTFRMGRIKGIVRLADRFGVILPLESPMDRSLARLVKGKEAWNGFWRRIGRLWRGDSTF